MLRYFLILVLSLTLNAQANDMYRFGITTDDPRVDTQGQVEVLAGFSKRCMVRVVFDSSEKASDYLESVKQISEVADVVGCILDSSAMPEIKTVSKCRQRAESYLKVLGDYVTVWEVGNEVNGDWLGSNSGKKIQAMYGVCKKRPTMLTLYYSQDFENTENDIFRWIKRNVTQEMRNGLDYVTVSYYEDQGNEEMNKETMEPIFQKLAAFFPRAQVGFGECGYGDSLPGGHADLIERFYNYRSNVPSYFGGCFWWHGRQTMVPIHSEDWETLDALMRR